MKTLNANWKKRVMAVLKIINNAGITYDSTTYCYTPAAPYPRSITPLTDRLPENFDFSNIPTTFYIHIPFCSRKCTFCPFFSNIAQEVPDQYIDAVIEHIELVFEKYKNFKKLKLYFGGGSPNLLSINQLRRIINAFRQEAIRSIDIELHPEFYDKPAYLQELAKIGIKRVSIGLEFSEYFLLKSSKRGHDAEILKDLCSEIKHTDLWLNIDIMYGGICDETIQSVYNTFKYAFQILRPVEITAYQVCIHKGTPEELRCKHNINNYPNTEMILTMCALGQQLASESKYNYYGKGHFLRGNSNSIYRFLKRNINPIFPNKAERENAVIGIGPGTYSYFVDKINSKDLIWYSAFSTDKYISLVRERKYPIERMIELDAEYIDSRRIISELRSNTNLSKNIPKNILSILEKLVSLGLLDKTVRRFQISDTGILIEDLICAALMPKRMWQKLSIRRKQKNYYLQDAKYDWFFEPDTVLKFQEFLIKL